MRFPTSGQSFFNDWRSKNKPSFPAHRRHPIHVTSHTFEFENARAAQALYAGDERLLKSLEPELDVRVTARDGWVKIEGSDDGVNRARRIFEQLETARKGGATIGKQEFSYAVRSSGENSQEPLANLVASKVEFATGKKMVVPKTTGQRRYLEAIRGHDITFGTGPAGTGKTYLAVAAAVSALKREEVSRIVLTRPAVEAGEALGFLPGDLQEKILPYLRPLYDALYDMLGIEEIQKYMDRGIIEIAPLAYMRGRTLNHSFVILDEAQNTTGEQMFMFLTRLGVNSRCIVTGDPTQIDLPRNKRSGMLEALEALNNVDGIAIHTFEEVDVVRHPLVQKIIRAYRELRASDEAAA